MHADYQAAITASFKWQDQVHSGVPVINAGAWFGKTWLLLIGGSYTPRLLIVEADNVTDAIDELADSERWGHEVRIPAEDYSDYGFHCQAGDCINGKQIDHECWLNLRGEEVQGSLSEPYVSGSGHYCDLDLLEIHGDERRDTPFPCVYHGSTADFPAEGMSPVEFHDRDQE